MIRFLLFVGIVLGVALPVEALEWKASTLWTNLTWAPSRQADTAGETFSGSDLYGNGSLLLTQKLKNDFSLSSGWVGDPIQRGRIFLKVGYSQENFALSLSPFVGTLTTSQTWFNPGMSLRLQATKPGLGFIGAGFLTTFAPVTSNGDAYTSGMHAEAGVYLEHGILTFSVENKAFLTDDNGVFVKDSQTRYLFDTDVFEKNIPFRLAVDLGYQTLNRTYTASAVTWTQIDTGLFGGRVSWVTSAHSSVFLKALVSLFSLGEGAAIYSVPSSTALFELEAGFDYQD